MSKIFVRSMLNNKTDNKFFSSETNAILDNNKIKYSDNGVTTVIECKDNELIISRKSNEYDIVLPLIKGSTTLGEYHIKQLGSLNLKVQTKEINIDSNRINALYTMIIDNESKSEFEFILEIGEDENIWLLKS